jgi:hypothetical protein
MPVGDRFAVAETAVPGDGFERVAGRMAEVEDAPRPGFAFVEGHDVRLDPARLGDDRHQRVGGARENRLALARDAIEERRARRHPVLDHFVEAGAEFAPRQGAEHERIDQNGVRLDRRRRSCSCPTYG